MPRSVTGTVQESGDVLDKTTLGGDDATEKVDEAKDTTEKTANDATDKAQDSTDAAQDTAEKTADDATDKADDTTESAGEYTTEGITALCDSLKGSAVTSLKCVALAK